MKRHLQELPKGRRFRLSTGTRGKVLRQGLGAVHVELEFKVDRSFRTRDGKEVRIRKKTKRTYLAPTAEVEVGR